MRPLNRQEKADWRSKLVEDDAAGRSLQADMPRRLRNALYALQELDPRWMAWIERELPRRIQDLPAVTRLVEARARTLLMGRHHFFDLPKIGGLLFSDDWLFTDRNTLTRI